MILSLLTFKTLNIELSNEKKLILKFENSLYLEIKKRRLISVISVSYLECMVEYCTARRSRWIPRTAARYNSVGDNRTISFAIEFPNRTASNNYSTRSNYSNLRFLNQNINNQFYISKSKIKYSLSWKLTFTFFESISKSLEKIYLILCYES